jgi:predicted amidohydrolase
MIFVPSPGVKPEVDYDTAGGRMTPFLLGVAQLTPARLDKQANLGRIESAMRQAAGAGARAIVFPELFLTGYFLDERLADLAEPLDGPSLSRLSGLAGRHQMLTVCGWPEAADATKPYNSAVVIERDGSIIGRYRKTHLFDREPEYFSAGEQLEVFDTSVGRIGVLICYDTEFPEAARVLALEGATILLTPTANMDPYSAYQAVYTRARAMENGVYVATANTVGQLDGFHFFGQSSVVGPAGDVVEMAGAEERLLLASVDVSRLPPSDPTLRYFQHRRPELYRGLGQVEAAARKP